MHTAVFEDDKGFGGKCFPKDVNGIYNVAKKFGVDAKVLKTIIEKNDKLTAIKDV
jgi:UDPglucose 6-dehydrogenase